MSQMKTSVLAAAHDLGAVFTWKRAVAVIIGAAAVALSAQFPVYLPGSPVPVTLQGLAVLTVGGLLGARAGALALVLYLLAGISGLPVFAPGGLPGVARLLGPTGGYLLAFPLAAALVGALAGRHQLGRCLLACLSGMLLIHLGGIAQLSILSGGLTIPMAATLPLVAADLLKVALAALLISRLRAGTTPRA